MQDETVWYDPALIHEGDVLELITQADIGNCAPLEAEAEYDIRDPEEIEQQEREEEERQIENPTPMMQLWRSDADEMGIPFQVQKGLIFLMAFGLRASYPAESAEDWISYTRQLSRKIRLKSPHIPNGEGGDFDDQEFSPLLTELAERFTGGAFSPRQIPDRTGAESPAVWAREGNGDMLPSCLCKGMRSMSDWDEVMTSLCNQIGRGICMNLEGAYLAGFLYFESQWHFDKSATVEIARLVSGMLPPKYKWFREILNVEAEIAPKIQSIQKVFDLFLEGVDEDTPFLHRLTAHLFGYVHFEGRDVRRAGIWELSVPEYAAFVVRYHGWFEHQEEPSAREVQNVRSILLEKGFKKPNRCKTRDHALAQLDHQVEEHWGYRIFDEDDDLSPGDNWIRRSCITYICVVNSVIDPDWNNFD